MKRSSMNRVTTINISGPDQSPNSFVRRKGGIYNKAKSLELSGAENKDKVKQIKEAIQSLFHVFQVGWEFDIFSRVFCENEGNNQHT